MKTLVVGAGAMGRWLGTVLKESGPRETSLSFLDPKESVAEDAASELDGTAVVPGEGDTYELVCLAVPIPATTTAIEEHAPAAETAIIDVTGTMEEPVSTKRNAAPDCERASLHPLFAPENEPGNVPTVVDNDGPVVEVVLDALRNRGNEIVETTAARHDEIMETVQARAHTAVLAFALSANTVPDAYQTPISAELFELADQVTGGESRVYADIQDAFEGAGDVADAAREIAAADRDAFEQLYENAARYLRDTSKNPTHEGKNNK